MKARLQITTAIAAALLAGACQKQDDDWGSAGRDTAICTDRAGNRVPDANCQQRGAYAGGSAGNAFLWYYLGRSSALPYYGQRAYGGSFTRTAGATYFHAPSASAMSRSAAISRGGFGSSARSFGGFGE